MPEYQMIFDTLEGERRYHVDVGSDERLEEVIRDILVELSEQGHVLKGVTAGDVKVVWAGQELNLSGTLPSQGVHPNEVLRVIIDLYEGGGDLLRRDRIDKDEQLLGRLSALNPGMLRQVTRAARAGEELIEAELLDSPAILEPRGDTPLVGRRHLLRIRYPRFYPEVPLELFVERPIFHPNVDADTGFVCLWAEARPRDNLVRAIGIFQAMAAYRIVNLKAAHLLNPAAAKWYSQSPAASVLPLAGPELRVFEVRQGRLQWLEPGRRLSSALTGPPSRRAAARPRLRTPVGETGGRTGP